MYFGYLLHPPHPPRASQTHWVGVRIHVYYWAAKKRHFIMLQCFDSQLTMLQINEYNQHSVIIHVALDIYIILFFYYWENIERLYIWRFYGNHWCKKTGRHSEHLNQYYSCKYHSIILSFIDGKEGKSIVRRCKRDCKNEVLYYDDNAVLTVRCNAQSYFKLWQGAERKAIQTSVVIDFFLGVFIFISIKSTQRGGWIMKWQWRRCRMG